jgi:hypothetical protein
MTEADANKSLDQTGSNAPYAALITTSSGYTYSAAHQFYSSLSNIVGTPQPITTPTKVNGTFDGDDVTFTAVSGTVVGAIVIYRQNAGANTTWRLVLFEDTSVTGLPVTPNGGNIVVTWNASGIFTLCSELLKRDIVEVGRLGPVGVYEYSYVGDDRACRHRGFLAHEVKQYVPEAVRAFAGVDHVNFAVAVPALARLHLS